MFQAIREQIDTVFREDPAARSVIEIILCYPGFQAILLHRVAHRLYKWGLPLFPRVLSQVSRFFTGIESADDASFTERARAAVSREIKRFARTKWPQIGFVSGTRFLNLDRCAHHLPHV